MISGYSLSGLQRFYVYIKRFLDIVISLLSLSVLFLPLLIFAILVKATSVGPILFKQTRVGQNRVLFTIYKFRTMYTEAPHDVATAEFDNADGYITKLGSFLRKTSIDELLS